MFKYFITFLCLNLYFLSNVLAQEVQFSIGQRFESARSSVIRMDSIVFFEDNLNRRYNPLGLNVNLPVSRRWDFQTGINFYRPSTNYGAYVDDTCSVCPVVKVTGVYYPTLEFPQMAGFHFFQSRNWKAVVLGGITPALRFIKKGSYHDASRYPDWSQEVADVLNAAPTTVKKAYVNYTYGLQIQYGRFTLRGMWQQNLSRNVANPLRVWDNQYHHVRRTGSLTLSLNFTVFKWRSDDNEN
jgi:hypothetical protein